MMKGFLCSVLILAACSSSDTTSPKPPSGANVYFVNFEGQSLTAGADDPTLNRSQLLSSSVTLPAYRASDAERTAKIQAIVQEVRAILAPYDIAVVTTRPASGAYDMAVIGGTSQQAGSTSGLLAQAVLDCAGAIARHISLVFDLSTGHEAARQIVGALGISHGISASTSITDCMCIAGAGCSTLPARCSIGGAGTPVSAGGSCEASGVTTMNVHQEFLAEFGAHP